MKIKNTTSKTTVLTIICKYLFQSKFYPTYLYNVYGSEGHSPDRQYVDKLIKKHGFWKTTYLILNK